MVQVASSPFLIRRREFDSRSLHVRWRKWHWVRFFSPIFPPISVISPILSTPYFMYHQHYIVLVINNVVDNIHLLFLSLHFETFYCFLKKNYQEISVQIALNLFCHTNSASHFKVILFSLTNSLFCISKRWSVPRYVTYCILSYRI